MATDRLDEDEKDDVSLTDTIGRTQSMTAVTESGLYALVLGSRKPEAKQFKRWITHEVIPTIRKTGGYVNNEQQFVDTYLPFADDGIKVLFSQTLGNGTKCFQQYNINYKTAIAQTSEKRC